MVIAYIYYNSSAKFKDAAINAHVDIDFIDLHELFIMHCQDKQKVAS